MAHDRTLCIFVSIGTILFETFFLVSLFLPRFAPFFFVGGLFFHIMLYLTSGHPFFEHMLLNTTLLLFYNPVWFPALWRRLTAGRDRARFQQPRRAPRLPPAHASFANTLTLIGET